MQGYAVCNTMNKSTLNFNSAIACRWPANDFADERKSNTVNDLSETE